LNIAEQKKTVSVS